MIKANQQFCSILATLYNHKLALLENFYLFRMKMCSRTSFEHLFKKDASFVFLNIFWESFELQKKFIKFWGVKTCDIWSPCIYIR